MCLSKIDPAGLFSSEILGSVTLYRFTKGKYEVKLKIERLSLSENHLVIPGWIRAVVSYQNDEIKKLGVLPSVPLWGYHVSSPTLVSARLLLDVINEE